MMKILFACGGTAGHINPAIAVANYMRDKDPSVEVLFAGNPHGMEAKIVPGAGYAFEPIKVLGIQRHISLRNPHLIILLLPVAKDYWWKIRHHHLPVLFYCHINRTRQLCCQAIILPS